MIKYSVFFVKRKKLFLSIFALVGLILASKISLDLTFSPVPITLQTLIVLIIALIFDKKIASMIVLSYLLIGLSGLAVFAGDKSGLSSFTGATGGFLVGFFIATILISFLNERIKNHSFFALLFLFILGHLIISGVGLLKLYFHVGDRFLEFGFYPFLPGLLIKSIVGATILYYLDKRKLLS